eukprot:m.224859 g.224859  ORF g.224859 m.224859 type:complete len:92 (-) comp54205_c1_seq18:378-653(-)
MQRQVAGAQHVWLEVEVPELHQRADVFQSQPVAFAQKPLHLLLKKRKSEEEGKRRLSPENEVNSNLSKEPKSKLDCASFRVASASSESMAR